MSWVPANAPGPAPNELVSEVASQAARSTPPPLAALVGLLQDRFGASLEAVLLYGSCLHGGDVTDGIVDLYALVDGYGEAYPGRGLPLANRLLPPNVFYAETAADDLTLRAKFAVLTMDHFEAGASRWFHSYVWARFAQPSRVLWTRDKPSRDRVHKALAQAVVTFLRTTAPTRAGETLDAEGIWSSGLGLTYGAELRPERATRVRYLTERNLPDYIRLTSACIASGTLSGVVEALPSGGYRIEGGPAERRRALWRWRLRRWQGRLLSVLRLGKSIFTFAGAVDYAVWKIHRHTGVTLEVSPRVRRHPVLMGPWVLWQLLRKGALR